jgi:pimeloyl-ACP methyl ester carboxylesterase
MKLVANGLSIDTEVFEAKPSKRSPQTVLLLMGLGMQRVAWPTPLIEAICAAGYRVITHDNRDIGLSDGFEDAGLPNMAWAVLRARLGWPLRPAYTLSDMARDSLGVLDALGIERAHVLGVSMGGMIAQRLAITAPQRITSLTSVMSTSGAPRLPGPRRDVLHALLRRPPNLETETLVAHYTDLFARIGSPGFPNEPGVVAARVRAGLQRAVRPTGSQRQLLAIAADQSRWRELGAIRTPTLVVHGRADVLVPEACGQDTARRIPGARYVGIDGMGHDLAPGVCEALLTHSLPFWSAHDA